MKLRSLSPLIAAAALVGGASLAPAQDAVPKIGLVDFARLQREFFRTDAERKAFEAKRDEERKKVEERRGKLKELLDAQEKANQEFKDPAISEDKRKQIAEQANERQGQVNGLLRELSELEAKINAELAQKANDVQRSLTKEIYDVIGEVAEAKGYDVVLNRTFGINGVPTVAYSSTKSLVDLTEEVSKKLNANAPAGWTPPKEGDPEIKP
jgi:Skp family chaperone for outer membrane proteins